MKKIFKAVCLASILAVTAFSALTTNAYADGCSCSACPCVCGCIK